MKLYYILFIINVYIYSSQNCESKSCYECYTKKICFWGNNTCEKSLNQLPNNNKRAYLTSQYNCIENFDDIKIYNNSNNETITLSFLDNKNYNEVNYKIYCFEYQPPQNLIIKIIYYDFKNDIKEISLYDGFSNKELSLSNNINDINLKTNFTCVKITYLFNSNVEKKNILTIELKTNKNDNINFHDIIINYNYLYFLQPFCLLICILLSIFILIATFTICHLKKQKSTIDSVVVINNFKINNSNENHIEIKTKNKEKYNRLKEASFLENNCNNINNTQYLSSFVNEIKNSQNKEIILKSIINTIQSFFVSYNNKNLIGIKCKFCESKLKFGDKVCLLNCGHLFHYECLYQQIITNEEYNCILCKKNIII